MTDVLPPPPPGDRIELVGIEVEMQRSYLDYAMSVIVGRALPDVRDGLKPVHRRVLYAMYDGGYRPDRGYFKCARVVGDVMGNYHPHGDTAIYDTLVRLAQPWSLRYPLVDGNGNFGSPGNDPAAAMRYTECRLAPLAMEMLREIDQETVDFTPNYDGRSQEPTILPSRIPNLLVNGSSGIAVGMATNIPPHNLREVAGGVQWYLENPEATAEELLDALLARVQGPGLPDRRAHRRALRHRGGLPHRARRRSACARSSRSTRTPRAARSWSSPSCRTRSTRDNLAEKIAELVARRQDRRHRRRPRRGLAAPGPAAGHRAQARRRREGRAEQPLQAHPAAGHVRLQHAGDRRRRAAHAAARRVRQLLRRAPGRGHRPAHPLPAAQGRGARAHPARLRQGARPPRRRHRAHPRQRRVGRGRPQRADGPARHRRAAGHRDPGHAAAPARGARAAADPGRAGRARARDRRSAGDPGRPGPPAPDHRRGARRRSSSGTATSAARASSPSRAT